MKPTASQPSFGRGGPGRMMGAPSAKPKHFKKTLRVLAGYLRPHRFKLIVVVVFAIASTVFMVISPRILGDVTNEVVNGYTAGQAYDKVLATLPRGVSLPAGTTGATILSHLPATLQELKFPPPNKKACAPSISQRDALILITMLSGCSVSG